MVMVKVVEVLTVIGMGDSAGMLLVVVVVVMVKVVEVLTVIGMGIVPVCCWCWW